MRLIVLFDLPTKDDDVKKAYIQFRRFLIKDGYDMLQYSVYVRLCNGVNDLSTHYDRLQKNLPKEGAIIAFTLTEKEYENKKILVGRKETFIEKGQIKGQLSLF